MRSYTQDGARENMAVNGDSPFRGTPKQIAIALVVLLIAIIVRSFVVTNNISAALFSYSILVAVFWAAIVVVM